MRILVIEDDKRIRENIQKILARSSFAVDTAQTADEGYEKAVSEEYDLIILDWMLPDYDGIKLLKKLKIEKLQSPVLLLTAKSLLDDKLTGLNSGADDYLTKPFSMEELIARIRAVLRRHANTQHNSASTPIIEIGTLTVDTATCSVTRENNKICLSPKEYALLEYLIKHKGKVIDRVEILSHVWDENTDMFTNTVDVHIRYLRNKIDKDFKNKLIKTVKGKGYGIWQD